MNTNGFYNEIDKMSYSGRDRELEISKAFPALMRKVYVWMTFALGITALTAYGVAHSETMLTMIYSNSAVMWGLIIAELALVIGLSAAINRLSLTTATLMFTLYSALNGAMLSSIFLVYSQTVITQVFLITAATFATMAAIGYFTKSDLSSMGRILFMALIGIVIATVVNMFLKSSGLDMILSYAGVLVFVGLTAYDSQKIKQMLAGSYDLSEGAQKIALLGSLTLYLDFVNMFLYLLRIFGRGDD